MSVLCMRGTMEGVLLHEEGSQRVPGSTCRVGTVPHHCDLGPAGCPSPRWNWRLPDPIPCHHFLTGNKGAVGVSFMFNGTSFGFVNCHLTSGNEKTAR